MDWREHPRLTLTGLILIVVAVIFLVARGCGCRWTGAPAARSVPEALQTAQDASGAAKTAGGNAPTAKPKKLWMDDCAEPPNWGREDATPKPAVPAKPPAASANLPAALQPGPAAAGNIDDSDSGPAPASAVRKSVRPKDLADWRRDDYYGAKRDGDPHLADAVTWLGERFAGNASAAELLVRLLDSGEDDPFAESRPHAAPKPDRKLIEAIVAALAANGTPLATRTLERLAAGKMKTADKEVAAAAALRGLASRPGQAGEDAIFAAVTASRPPRSANPPGSDLPALRSTTMALVKSSASEALRVRLARHATEPQTPQPLFDELWECMKEPRTENLAAQIIFYQSNRLAETAVEALEVQLTLQGAAALARSLSLPAKRDRQAAADAAAAATDPDRAAGLIWSGDVTAIVAARLRMIDGFSQGGRLLRLAAVIPSQPMRVAMLQTLESHWEEGPRGLDSLLSSDGALQEPGFLLVVKKLPRKDPPPTGHSAKPAKPAGSDSKRRQDEIAQQWMAFSETLTRAMCQRFCAAGLAPSAGGKRTDADVADLPIKPHPNAEATTSYRVDWPNGLKGKSAGAAVSPLRVRYLRVEQKVRPVRLLAYYRAQLTNCTEHTNPNGYWLDTFTTDKQRGAVRSIDVLITKRNKDIPFAANEEQQLTVEILFVEIESASRAPRGDVASRGT